MLAHRSGYQGPYAYKYPNFPKTIVKTIRSSSDITGNTVSNLSDGPGGQGAVRMQVATTGRGFYVTFSPAIDVRNGVLKFWFRCLSSMSTMSAFTVRMASSGTPSYTAAPTNSLGLTVWGTNALATLGWQYIGASTSDTTTQGTGADLSAITWMYFNFTTTSGTLNYDFSDIVFTPNPRTKAAVIFRADDATPSAYTWLFPTLQAAGFRGHMHNGGACASSAGFDQFGRITTANMNAIRAGGGQFMSQSWSTENVPGSGTAADYAAQFSGMKSWTKAKGWMDGYGDGSFYSFVGPNIEIARQQMVKSGIRTIQRFDNGNPTNPPLINAPAFPFIDELNIPALNVAQPGGTTTNIPVYIGYELTKVKSINGVLILAGHDDWNDPNVQTAVNNVIADATAGNIEIHTMNSLLNPYLATYGPAPSRY